MAVRWGADAYILAQKRLPPRQPAHGGRAQRKRVARHALPGRPAVRPCGDLGVRHEWVVGGDGEASLQHHKVHLGFVYSGGGKVSKGPIDFCSACGAYFWRRIASLAEPCRRSGGAQARRCAVGRFPCGKRRGWRVESTRQPSEPERAQLAQQRRSARAV